MFKKSLLILLVCGLLTLAWIVGYVLLRVRGPVDELRHAEAQLALGHYAQVIAALNQAEHSASIQSSVSLQVRLWRIRAEAQASLDNPAGALKDVRQLLGNGFKDDIELRLDEIRYLATDGQGELARQRAKSLLAHHPDHSRALELAGEACQTAYQPLLRDLLANLDRDLGKSNHDEARKKLLTYLFRPGNDPMVKQAGSQLEGMFQADARLQQTWPQVWADARALRERIQEGLGYFQKSIDLGGETVAAFQAIATALEQSGRIDDLLFACEIQRRMFDHMYVVESGALAAWIRLQHHLPTAAIATTERWLPEKRLAEYAEAGKITTTTEQLLIARALAAWQLRNKAEMGLTQRIIRDLRDLGFVPQLPLHISLATRRMGNRSTDFQQIESSLGRVIAESAEIATPLNRPDLIREFAEIWIDTLEQSEAPEDVIANALKLWRNSRPDDVEPVLRLAKYLLDKGRTPAALTAVEEAADIAPDHPGVFPLHLRIALTHHENSAQDGANLLNQCIRNRTAAPEVRDPIGYILCAQAALDQKDQRLARIALSCARNAISAFPTANIPRQLELQALILDRQIVEAAQTADQIVESFRPDAATLFMAIQAKKLAGESVRQLIRLALPLIDHSDSESDDLIQLELLRIALEDAPTTADQFISPSLTAKGATIEQRVTAIAAYVGSSRLGKAESLLRKTTPSAATEDQELLTQALSELATAKAHDTADDKLLEFVRAQRLRLQLKSGSQLAMFRAAEQLAQDHPRTALDLLSHSLPIALPEERTGGVFILAGDLALRAKDAVRAESYWLAALAFPEGARICERLARLLLVQGRLEAARKVYALTNDPTDPALAARFELIKIAATLLGDVLQQEPTDLLTHAALAIFSDAPMLDWKQEDDEIARLQRIDLVAGLRDPLLGWLCVPLAKEVLGRTPKSKTSSLMMARALSDAGEAEAAGKLHAEVFKANYKNPVMWREVAYAGQQPGYATSPELMQRLMQVTLSAEPGNSQLTRSYSAEQIVKGFEAGGHDDMAKQTRLMQWLTMPHLRPCTDADLALITAGHLPQDACSILDQVLSGPHPCDRSAVRSEFYRVANQLAAADQKQAQQLVAMARGQLKSEGAFGEIVHFLMSYPSEAEPVDASELLLAHLEMIATARDNADYLNQTLDALTQEVGIIECSRVVENTLDNYPTSLPMWTVRAALNARIESEGQGLDDLRTVLTHAQSPRARMRFLTLAAAERRLSPADTEQWQKLPKDLLKSPEGAYLRALMALRQGKADKAVELFADGAPQYDGRHLFELALAHLESTAEDGVESACAALTQLQKDYPNSLLAQNAGSFLRQLSPRP